MYNGVIYMLESTVGTYRSAGKRNVVIRSKGQKCTKVNLSRAGAEAGVFLGNITMVVMWKNMNRRNKAKVIDSGNVRTEPKVRAPKMDFVFHPVIGLILWAKVFLSALDYVTHHLGKLV